MPNLGWRRGNRGDALWLRGKSVPRGATRINENGMAFEDAVAEVSLRGTARCAAFRPSCGARACRRPVPSRSKSSTSSDGTTTLRHLAADLLEMQVHRLGVGIRTTARYRDAGGRRHPRHGLALCEPAPLVPPPRPCGWGARRWLRPPCAGPFLAWLPAHCKKRPLQGLGLGRVNDVSKCAKPASLNLSAPVVK
jgi:hypothetical protein